MLGYRKFIVTMLGILSSDGALYLGRIDGTTWATLVGALIAGFMALNMVRKTQATVTPTP